MFRLMAPNPHTEPPANPATQSSQYKKTFFRHSTPAFFGLSLIMSHFYERNDIHQQ